MIRLLKYWGPPLLWMAFIFSLSAHHKVAFVQTYWQDVAIKKGLHMVEYAILYFLFFRANHQSKKKSADNKEYIVALLYTLIYAVFDEIHQTFVPTREGVIRDVGIDFLGMCIMVWYIKRYIQSLRYFL